MKVLIVTQWFDPEPTAKGILFARKLADLGNDVTVITGFPNYPAGRLYPGYRIRPYHRSEDGPVRIIRVPLYPSHDTNVARRLLNYASFAASSTIASLIVPRADVAYIYHPPGSIGLPALALRFLRNIPFVYDIQDMWPESLAATDMLRSAPLIKVLEAWMLLVYRAATLVVVQSPGFSSALMRKRVPKSKIRLIYNWTFEQTEYDMESPTKIPVEFEEMAFHVVYPGNVGAAQQLDVVLDAAEILQREVFATLFHVVGDGVDLARLRSMVAKRNIKNVIFHGRRRPAEMPAILAAADAILIHLRDDPLFAITIPSKTQASLLAGRPILMAVRGDAATLVREARSGFVIMPSNPTQLASAVKEMAALPHNTRHAMGCNGKAFYEKNLAPEVGVAKFAATLKEAQILHRRAQRLPKRRAACLLSLAAIILVACRAPNPSHRTELVIFRGPTPQAHPDAFTSK